MSKKASHGVGENIHSTWNPYSELKDFQPRKINKKINVKNLVKKFEKALTKDCQNGQ